MAPKKLFSPLPGRIGFTSPKAVNPEKVDAEYRNGVLTVTLAKSEEVKPKRIAIKMD